MPIPAAKTLFPALESLTEGNEPDNSIWQQRLETKFGGINVGAKNVLSGASENFDASDPRDWLIVGIALAAGIFIGKKVL